MRFQSRAHTKLLAGVGSMNLHRVFLDAQVDRDHLIEFVVGN